MFSYLAYGLGIQSRLPLPEFVPAEAGCDVVIDFDAAAITPSEVGDTPWYVRVTPAEAVIADKDLGVFVIRGGRHVTVIPARGADEGAVRLYLVGTVMAILLYQRGRLPLHASAIEIAGEAVGFLGVSGAGKSSMAAALQARGHRLVADDVTGVQVEGRSALTFPAFPQLKLMPDAAASVGCDPAHLFFLNVTEEKRGYRPTGVFSGAPLPIRQLYVLVDDPAIGIDRLRPHDAVVEFVRHSYPTRMLQPGGPAHFLQCAQLTRTIPTYRLRRPRALSLLRDVAALVEDHARRSTLVGAL